VASPHLICREQQVNALQKVVELLREFDSKPPIYKDIIKIFPEVLFGNFIPARIFWHKMEQPDVKGQEQNGVVHFSKRERFADVQNAVQCNAHQVQECDDKKHNRHRVRIQINH
jgi:hypothetical protein